MRTRIAIQHVKASQILVKSPSSFSGKLTPEMYPLVFGDILEVFVNTMTAHAKYPVQDCENLLLPIQMQLSEKPKAFSNFLFHFWNLH